MQIHCLRIKLPLHLPQACNFIEKEALAQVFPCEFFEIFKNTFITEHLWTTASYSSNLSKIASNFLEIAFEVMNLD